MAVLRHVPRHGEPRPQQADDLADDPQQHRRPVRQHPRPDTARRHPAAAQIVGGLGDRRQSQRRGLLGQRRRRRQRQAGRVLHPLPQHGRGRARRRAGRHRHGHVLPAGLETGEQGRPVDRREAQVGCRARQGHRGLLRLRRRKRARRPEVPARRPHARGRPDGHREVAVLDRRREHALGVRGVLVRPDDERCRRRHVGQARPRAVRPGHP